MKTLFPLLFIFILTSCSTSWDTPPKGYKVYQTRKTNDEQIKQDMIACGFPDVQDENSYANNDREGFVGSVICMEKKGYKGTRGLSICSSIYSETKACQKHLSETQGKKNRK